MKIDISGDNDLGFGGSAEYEPGIDTPLLPCPFCGGTELEVANTHTPSYWVECGGCGAQQHGNSSGAGRVCSYEQAKRVHTAAFEAAIAAWNSRADEKRAAGSGADDGDLAARTGGHFARIRARTKNALMDGCRATVGGNPRASELCEQALELARLDGEIRLPQENLRFGGKTYDPALDEERLFGSYRLDKHRQGHGLAQGCPLCKRAGRRGGGRSSGLWHYRLTAPDGGLILARPAVAA